MENKIKEKVNFAIRKIKVLDVGRFIKHKDDVVYGDLKVEAKLYKRYLDARYKFELLHDEIFRMLPASAKRELYKDRQFPTLDDVENKYLEGSDE